MSEKSPPGGLSGVSLKNDPSTVPILAQINEHVFRLFGADMREAYTNAGKFVEMNLAVFQYYGLDLPGFYYDIYNIEAEALGQRLNWDPRADARHRPGKPPDPRASRPGSPEASGF